jgi:thioredoxin reductase (NADPH)
MSEAERKKEKTKVLVVGSGPAGHTAALYAARADLEPIVFEGPQPGGQLTITTEVENFPGFPEGVMGPELMDKFREQAAKFGARIIGELVQEIDLVKPPFRAVSEGYEVEADSVILAMGASARLLGIESETKLMGYGVSACATCDGFFARGMDILVVGGGDSAMEEANFLTKFANKVTIVHRREGLRASKIMEQRARENPKIEWALNNVITEIHGTAGKEGVTGVTLKNTQTGETSELACGMVFMAIGHRPNTDLVKGKIDLDEDGYITREAGSSRTNIPGVFAAGDVADRVYRQAITAAGSGCMAAIDAERWLAHGG